MANSPGLLKYGAALVALAICVACATASAPAPSTGAVNARYVGKTLFLNGTPVTAARVNLNQTGSVEGGRFAMTVPGRPAKSKFEYVINNYGTYAGIFDYPKSTKEIGKIANVGGQGCTHVLYGYGKKTFWIVAAYNHITEYAVPKKPIKRLSDSVGMPSSCAMNGSGDLAVGILDGSGAGDVVIYKNASGPGSVVTTPLRREYFDGYDNDGNLFADGFTYITDFGLFELSKGSGKFQKITTSNKVDFPGSVQWDGTYLTVLDQNANAIYRYAVNGTKATLKGTVTLKSAGDCAQTWIVKGLVYCADAVNGNGEVFRYPTGGKAIATFTGSFDLPLGVVAADE